jgi:hypothetical protein
MTVIENSENRIISLLPVFKDVDNELSEMTYSVSSNTNTQLLTPTVSGSDLAVVFTKYKFGEGAVVLKAASGGKSVETELGITVQYDETTGLEETVTIKTYPNPVVDELNIQLDKESTIVLLNSNGQEITRLNTFLSQQTIDMRSMSSGLYVLVVQTNEGEVRRKIVKQ